MSAGIVSLLAVTIAFVALLVYVFRPGSRDDMDAKARLPFDDESDAPADDDGPGDRS